jgi:formylglycine-generating enzyme required for sulfatase activity
MFGTTRTVTPSRPEGNRVASHSSEGLADEIRESPIVAEPSAANVTFVSTPPGATVWVNGRQLPGRTPITRIAVRPGRSSIEFRLADHGRLSIDRKWNPGAADRVEVRLRPLPARVTFVSIPVGAAVWVNGRRLLQETPVKNAAVRPGRSRVEFHRYDHEPVLVEREWYPNATDRVEVRLRPLSAHVTFVSQPSGATVWLNGRELPGKTPLTKVPVGTGRSRVEFRLADHEPVVVERQWDPKSTDRVEARLLPLPARVTLVSVPPGATVSVDGRRLPGTTPIEMVSLRPGRSTIEFHLDNHEPVRVEREWLPNTTGRVEVRLSLHPGAVRLDTGKAWERLEIDGTAMTAAPNQPWDISPGRHTVRAYRGDEVAEAAFDVTAGSEVAVQLVWRRLGPDRSRYALLPAARVVLGSQDYSRENPPRTLEMGAFWIGRTEVTVGEYHACVDAGGCQSPGTGADCNWNVAGRDEHPVNCVSVADARAYATWLSGRDGLPYRLPTADQWERAARGTSGRRYPWGDGEPARHCNTCDRSCRFQHFRNGDVDDGWQGTAPVEALSDCVGPEGVFDLVGNVAEWCQGDGENGSRGVRGGSWAQIGALLDPAFPSYHSASDRDPTIGFRLAVSHPPETDRSDGPGRVRDTRQGG